MLEQLELLSVLLLDASASAARNLEPGDGGCYYGVLVDRCPYWRRKATIRAM